MGGKHDVVHFHQGILNRQRFVFKDIQRGPRETFGLQRFDQRFLLDNRSTRRVDQHRI